MTPEVKQENLEIFSEGCKMIKTYKIISLLLTYPEADLQDFLPEAQKIVSVMKKKKTLYVLGMPKIQKIPIKMNVKTSLERRLKSESLNFNLIINRKRY